MPCSRWKLTALSAAALAAFPVPALPDDQVTYKVDVSVVNVLATVRDRDGRIVSDLTKDDFILEEEGKRQEIRYFLRQTDLPLTVGLLVDTSMSQRELIDTERRASYQFFEQVLRPEQDVAFVIRFDAEVELLQDLTGSRQLLEAALKLLQTPRPEMRRNLAGFPSNWQGGQRGGIRLPGGMGIPLPGGGGQRSPGGGRPGPGGRPGRGAGIGTALYDAVFLAADEVLPKQTGRKAMILISDGVDAGSKISEQHAIEAAQRADTIVYCVRYYDPDAYPQGRGRGASQGGQGARGEKALKAISAKTGGRMFEVTKKLTLDQIFDQIQEELRNQYNIGYTPSTSSGDGFRRIKLSTKNNKLQGPDPRGLLPEIFVI